MSEPTKSIATSERIAEARTAAGRQAATPATPALFSTDEIKHFIALYAANPLFADTEQWTIHDNPYRRPVDQGAVGALDFSKPITRDEFLTASALAANRMLLNIYESDLIFLPEDDFTSKQDDWTLFYSNENKLLGEMIRPSLESHVFGFLDGEIAVPDNWSPEALRSYLGSLLETHEQAELELVTAILSSKEPEKNAVAYLIQVASDFLSESSATARNVLGKYGTIQSELFKILIDDYGYGVHHAKHSTLFENTMESCGLSTKAHSYWQFYLSSSLAIGNYYHYVSRDHGKFFKCLGAIAYAETMFAHTCREIAKMLRRVFGTAVDTRYFDEHGHIDAYHGSMALEKLVMPAIAKYGNGVIAPIVRGLEEIRVLTAISDEDFLAQIAWSDALQDYKSLARQIYPKITSGEITPRRATHVVRQQGPLIMRVYDTDQLCTVEHGSMNLVGGYDRLTRITAGEGIVIPRHRLNGIEADSADCVLNIYDIGDYRTYLS
jgi:hypothetical protein